MKLQNRDSSAQLTPTYGDVDYENYEQISPNTNMEIFDKMVYNMRI